MKNCIPNIFSGIIYHNISKTQFISDWEKHEFKYFSNYLINCRKVHKAEAKQSQQKLEYVTYNFDSKYLCYCLCKKLAEFRDRIN